MLPYGRQSINEDDIKAVTDVLRSDWITQGPVIEKFEREIAGYCGAKYAVAVSSGTAALHIACLAVGIKHGDEVITSPMTFVASANCVLYCGGKPVFVDVQPDTINIDPEEIKKNVNRNTKAIIPVHFAGHPCEMEKIEIIAKEHNLVVIEDACHALGAEYRTSQDEWVKVGSCKHSDMTIFSFHPVKSITTGEGGAILTNNKDLYEKLIMLRSHGITKKSSQFTVHSSQDIGSWHYEMQMLGYNYRITDFQCALGFSQFKKLNSFLFARKNIAKQYDDMLSGINSITIPCRSDRLRSANHLYVIQVEKRNEIFQNFIAKGIGVQVHYIPVYMQPFYSQNFNINRMDFPNSENYFKKAISLPIYPSLTDKEIAKVVEILIESLKAIFT